MANHRPPAEFDMNTPEKAARAGNELVDEIEQIAERYPDAEIARDEANGDMDAFFGAAADLVTVNHRTKPRSSEFNGHTTLWNCGLITLPALG